MSRCFLLSLFAAIAVCFARSAGAEEDAQSARWVWHDILRDSASDASFRKIFSIDGVTTSARLQAAVDFTDATILINDQVVASLESYGPTLTIDVSEYLTRGENSIVVRCSRVDGPSAFALRMELTRSDGAKQLVASDATWLASAKDDDEWKTAEMFGVVSEVRWSDPAADTGITAVDDYTQWKQAIGGDAGAGVGAFFVPEGFEIELLRSAAADEDSWVSMAFDPQGRIIIAKEKEGLLRLTLPTDDTTEVSVETVNDTLLECRGLLFAHDALYANANNSKGLYRLRDTNDDDTFDNVQLLLETSGGVGHGRNDLALGPDGMIYSIHGDAVDIPRDCTDRTSPLREHRRGAQTREGHVLRIDPDGENVEVIAAGLRNPFGIALNEDGEIFTYDADAEHDMGSPWYRPTRVNHILPGGDFGWRGVTGQWPPYFPDRPDVAPPTLDIGKGSPTSVAFGTASNFPPRYRAALFVLDWAYGRILCVTMTPRGASYACRGETFAKGRPLNVTDLAFGPDGALYFVTGGRATQSGLYRVRYTGPTDIDEPTLTDQQIARQAHAGEARSLRRRLELLHGSESPDAIAIAWPHLDSPDPAIRHAARIAIEHQPIEQWSDRALSEQRPTAALTALMSLAASGQDDAGAIAARLNEFDSSKLSRSQKLMLLRGYSLCLDDVRQPPLGVQLKIAHGLEDMYPDTSFALNQELSTLLVRLDSPLVVERTLDLLAAATRQEQQMHYLFVLRDADSGWTPELREQYFLSFALMSQFLGGEGMPNFQERIKQDAVESLDPPERRRAWSLITAGDNAADSATDQYAARPLVKNWKLDDLAELLVEPENGVDLANGKAMFTAALCIRCHRVGIEGSAIGPDLTSVASRFSRRDMLDHILSPSKVVAEQYQTDVITTTDGRVLTGRIIESGDYRSPSLRIATDPLDPRKSVELQKIEIESHTRSPLSRMPQGLLDTLTSNDILDLLAYLQSGGATARASRD